MTRGPSDASLSGKLSRSKTALNHRKQMDRR